MANLEALGQLLKDLRNNCIEGDENDIHSYNIILACALKRNSFNKRPTSECAQLNSDSFICAPPSVDELFEELKFFLTHTLENLFIFKKKYSNSCDNPDWNFEVQSEILHLMLNAKDIIKNIINKNLSRLKAFAIHNQELFSDVKSKTKATSSGNDCEPLSTSAIDNDCGHTTADKQFSPSQEEDDRNAQDLKSYLPNDTVYFEENSLHSEEDYKIFDNMRNGLNSFDADETEVASSFNEFKDIKESVVLDGQDSPIEFTQPAVEETKKDKFFNVDTDIQFVEHSSSPHSIDVSESTIDMMNLPNRNKLMDSEETFQELMEGLSRLPKKKNCSQVRDVKPLRKKHFRSRPRRTWKNASISQSTSDSSDENDEFESNLGKSDSEQSNISSTKERQEDEQSQCKFVESEEYSSEDQEQNQRSSLHDECSPDDIASFSEDSSISSSSESDIVSEANDQAGALPSTSSNNIKNFSNSDRESKDEVSFKATKNYERGNILNALLREKNNDMGSTKEKNAHVLRQTLFSHIPSCSEKEYSNDDPKDHDDEKFTQSRWKYDLSSQKPLSCTFKKSLKTYLDEENTKVSLKDSSDTSQYDVIESQKEIRKRPYFPLNLSTSVDEANSSVIDNLKKQKRLPTKSGKKKQFLERMMNGRRNIRVIMDENELNERTRKAGEEEETRKKRIEERQALLDQVSLISACASDTSVQKLVLDYDDEKKEELVSVSPDLLKILKPYQVSGVRFMWNACFESLKHIADGGEGGCILAHCMGLGKTLQVITLVHTLFSHKETKVNTALVICPCNTVFIWRTEFDKWLKDDDKINCYDLNCDKYRTYAARTTCLEQWATKGGVMIVSYEFFRKLVDQNTRISSMLLNPGPDLVICDEGHLLKNNKSHISKTVMKIRTRRRIVLTGTPFQNSLLQYFCMVNFVKPGLLGNRREFQNRFINPITNGRFKDSKLEDVKLMKDQSCVLHRMLSGVLQRLDYTELKPFLEPKYEFAIFFRMSDLQSKLYEYYIEKRNRIGFSSALFSDYPRLRLLWTHPLVLKFRALRSRKDKEKEYDGQRTQWCDNVVSEEDWNNLILGMNLKDASHDPKLISFFTILDKCEESEEKLLVFSSSLVTLDMIEYFLRRRSKNTNVRYDSWKKGHDYLRLDGETSHELRSKYCDIFNDPNNPRSRLFLISTRAGGLGINLTGANRVIIYDVSWNPADDNQSTSRVYRLGQKKPCYVYRFIAQGTMEEKIYERQITKLSVACRVVDEQQIQRHYLRKGVKELYTFKRMPPIEIPHKLPRHDQVLSVLLEKYKELIVKYEEHDALLENIEEEQLTEIEREAAWEKNKLYTPSRNLGETIPNNDTDEDNIHEDQSISSNLDHESVAKKQGENILKKVDGDNETSTSEKILMLVDDDAIPLAETEVIDILGEDLEVSSSEDDESVEFIEEPEKPSEKKQSPVFNSKIIHDAINIVEVDGEEFEPVECQSQPSQNEIALSVESGPLQPLISSALDICENSCEEDSTHILEHPENSSVLEPTNISESVEIEMCDTLLDPEKTTMYDVQKSDPIIKTNFENEEKSLGEKIFPVTDERIGCPEMQSCVESNQSPMSPIEFSSQVEHSQQADEVIANETEEKAELLKSFFNKCQPNSNENCESIVDWNFHKLSDTASTHDACEEENEDGKFGHNLSQADNVSILSINVSDIAENSDLEDDELVRKSEKNQTDAQARSKLFVKMEPAEEFEEEDENLSRTEVVLDRNLTPNDEDTAVLDKREFSELKIEISGIQSSQTKQSNNGDEGQTRKETKSPVSKSNKNCDSRSAISHRHEVDKKKSEEEFHRELKFTNNTFTVTLRRKQTKKDSANETFNKSYPKREFSKKNDADRRSDSPRKTAKKKRNSPERYSERNYSYSHPPSLLKMDFDDTDIDSGLRNSSDEFSHIDERPCARLYKSSEKKYRPERSEYRPLDDQTWRNQRKRRFYSSAEGSRKRMRTEEQEWRPTRSTSMNTRFRKEDHSLRYDQSQYYERSRKYERSPNIQLDWRSDEDDADFYPRKDYKQEENEESNENYNSRQYYENHNYNEGYKRTQYHKPPHFGKYRLYKQF